MDFDLLSVIENPVALMQLRKQGFKFEPSPEQLIIDYLVPKTRGDIMKGVPMAELYLCEHDPWDLPAKSLIKNLADHAWYFFCPRDLKYKHGKLIKRKTKSGHWKSTCKIKPIMAELTKKTIGVMNTLTFYKTDQQKDERTGWMIYEFDLITDSSLHQKGPYVLCRLEYKSEDKKTRKGEQSHHIASSVSHSEVEPSQSMASYFENNNPSQMAVDSPCDQSELSHHVVSDFGNQNSSELMNTSARQLSELSHHMASHFTNQNSNKPVSSLAYDGSGSSHSTVFNSDNPYWNQPTVDSAYNGSENHYMAFNSENPNWNRPTADLAYEGIESPYMTFDSENQNPNKLLTVDSEFQNPNNQYTAFDSENQNPNVLLKNQNPNKLLTVDSENQYQNKLLTVDSEFQNPNNQYMAFDSENQNTNVLLTVDSASNVSGCHYMSFHLENQNLNNSISISNCENSLMASHVMENQESPFPPEGQSCPSMVTPCSFTNQPTYEKSEPSNLMAFYFENKNLDEEIDISGFGEGERSYLTAAPPDFRNQNPGKKTDMSTLEENYSESSFFDNDLADVDLPEFLQLSPELLAEMEGFFSEHGNSPNMSFGTSAST